MPIAILHAAINIQRFNKRQPGGRLRLQSVPRAPEIIQVIARREHTTRQRYDARSQPHLIRTINGVSSVLIISRSGFLLLGGFDNELDNGAMKTADFQSSELSLEK